MGRKESNQTKKILHYDATLFRGVNTYILKVEMASFNLLSNDKCFVLLI